MKSLRTRAARGTLINTAFAAALGALGLLESFILARFVTRSAYGVWGVLAVTLGTFLWLKQVGVGDKYVQQDEADQELAFQQAFTLELAFTAALTVLLLASVPVIVLAYGLPQLIAPGLVVAAALFVSTWQAPQWVFYRRMDFGRQRALAAVDPVVGFAVSVALAVAGAGYWAFVGGLAAGACAASGAAVLKSPVALRLRYEPGTLRSYARFSGPLLVASGASLVIAWSAMIAAKLDLGVGALGVVALTATIAGFAERVDQLVTGTLYPAICAVRENRQLLYESFVKSNRLALMWAVPFGFALTLFAPDLVRFGIGTRWRPAVVVLQVYGAAAALNHLGFNWTAYFRALGKTRPIAVAAVTAMAVFLAVGIPLLLIWGLPGFAVGVALQGLAALACRAYYLRSVFPGFDMLRHAARSLLPTLPGAAVVLALRAVERHPRTLVLALGELAVYALVTITATWWAEASLLREAVGIVRGQDPAPAH
ncbi:MAG: oligosaccharide flippase family protein [Solirubrobacterales bacterium]|nr:oligosaccharide flippase family protein [Solirubrobacterales bacterium]